MKYIYTYLYKIHLFVYFYYQIITIFHSIIYSFLVLIKIFIFLDNFSYHLLIFHIKNGINPVLCHF